MSKLVKYREKLFLPLKIEERKFKGVEDEKGGEMSKGKRNYWAENDKRRDEKVEEGFSFLFFSFFQLP